MALEGTAPGTHCVLAKSDRGRKRGEMARYIGKWDIQIWAQQAAEISTSQERVAV
jgi:hypothetical protein